MMGADIFMTAHHLYIQKLEKQLEDAQKELEVNND
jgi:hypothetical protein